MREGCVEMMEMSLHVPVKVVVLEKSVLSKH